MKKRTSKLLSLLLTLTMVLGMLPAMSQVAYAAGEITELTAIGVVAPVVGEYPNVSGITAPTGAHYTIGDVSWRSSTDPTWTGNTPFQEGYVYRIYIEFIPEDGYEISDSAAVSINGVEYWYSKFASSNTITGAKEWMFYFNALGNAPLTITNDGSLNIPAGSCEQEIIETLDLKTSVTGGKAPYFYSITGPTWLSLNAYDCIVGTRPDTPQAATTATITVTDSDSPKNTASVTIQVGAVTENSNLIKQLTAIGVTPPAVGEMPTTAGIVAPTSANYTVESASWRRIGDDWLGNTAFEAGYRYQLFLRFVPKAGYEIANSEALSSVTLDGVNGYAWSRNSVNTITGAIGITFTFKTLGESTSDYNVTINNDGNGTASASPTSGPDGTVVTLTATPNPGYKFKEWVREEGMLSGGLDVPNATSATTTFEISGYDVVVKATFEEDTTAPKYNVTVNNDGNGTASASPTIGPDGTVVTLTATPNPGYKFKEWVREEGMLSGGLDVPNATSATTTFMISGYNVVVKATFELIPTDTYTVSFDANGGTGSMADATGVSGDYVLPVCSFTAPNGKQFKAWSVGGVEKAAGDTITVNANTTVTAIWENIPVVTYTVSFAANGGTGTMADVTGISGEYTLPENGFTAPAGKQFKAWMVGSTEKAVGDKITVTANTTVTAVWETIPAGHTCDIKPVAKVEPSCTEGGKEAYYKCEGCGKFYEDALGAKEITDLAAWGNIAKNGHTESDWKSDKDNHWKECTVAACGVIIENSKAAHADANNDGKCDVCEYNVGTANKPSDDVQSPQTGDNSMMWLWVALLFVSGFGVVATTVISKKKTSAK